MKMYSMIVKRSLKPLYRPFNIALLASLILALLTPGTAAAHLGLERSNPNDGEILETNPEFVQVWFNEELDTFESQIIVSDSAGKQIDLGDSHVAQEDRTELRVSLPASLPPGEYHVHWIAVDDIDGHAVEGDFVFNVAGIATIADDPETTNTTTGLFVVLGGGMLILFASLFAKRKNKN